MSITYNDLSDFERAYVETIYFTDSVEDDHCDRLGVSADNSYRDADLEPEETLSESALVRIRMDCYKFLGMVSDRFNVSDPTDIFERAYIGAGHSDATIQAARDFWYTRNGHGVGFWETSDWEESDGKILTAIAEQIGECWSYIGDDEMIYIN